MPSQIFDSAKHWLERAKQAHAIAEAEPPGELRAKMSIIAKEYEQMAAEVVERDARQAADLLAHKVIDPMIKPLVAQLAERLAEPLIENIAKAVVPPVAEHIDGIGVSTITKPLAEELASLLVRPLSERLAASLRDMLPDRLAQKIAEELKAHPPAP